MAKRKSLLKNFYPKYTFEKVEDIPYELIKRDGIKLILMDMDNTLIDNRKEYSKNLKKWIKDIKAKCRKGFKAVCEQFPDISKSEIMMVGDQLFTDIWGGNRFNINTVLVRRINKKENIVSAIKRPIERLILIHYYNKEENKEKCKV